MPDKLISAENEFSDNTLALNCLTESNSIPHRSEGERVVLELLPFQPRRILDIGTGDGHLLALVKEVNPASQGVALDFSHKKLEEARARFEKDETVTVIEHDLRNPLPDLGTFDVIITGFTIHHLNNKRKFSLYEEVFNILEPDGVFCNLEHVSSPTTKLHEDFYKALGKTMDDEDPAKQCISMEKQLDWLRQIGFAQVDCYWKWRELALLAGIRE